MKKIELLAPAGDLERLKIAVLYGADAVYLGGKQFSLRSRASNFDLADIAEGVKFAQAHGAHVHAVSYTHLDVYKRQSPSNLPFLFVYLLLQYSFFIHTILILTVFFCLIAVSYTHLA